MGSFGSLERVDFPVRDNLFSIQMAREVAGAECPLAPGIGRDPAIFPGREIHHVFAAFTPLDDGVALSSVEPTPLLCHKGALHIFPNRRANHL